MTSDAIEEDVEHEDKIKKEIEICPDKFLLSWKYQDVEKKLTYDINKCIGCSLCKLVCPVDAIELGPVPEIAQEILDKSTPKILIDHDKCCYCMLCVVVCPNDAFHENIAPEGQINMDEYPSIGKFYTIDKSNCIEDQENEVCRLCLSVRDRNKIEDYYLIEKKCPTNCFHIDSPIKGEVIIKKNMLHKCTPENCKACINICPVDSFYVPETAEDVLKYGKIACNEDECFYCGACENSCPDDLIIVKRNTINIEDPKEAGHFAWKKSWIRSIEEILREKLVESKDQIPIPLIEEEIEAIREKITLQIPQLSEEDKKELLRLNDKIQEFLKLSKVRYWIKDKKLDKITRDLRKVLSE